MTTKDWRTGFGTVRFEDLPPGVGRFKTDSQGEAKANGHATGDESGDPRRYDDVPPFEPDDGPPPTQQTAGGMLRLWPSRSPTGMHAPGSLGQRSRRSG